jgi:hypothetical protein
MRYARVLGTCVMAIVAAGYPIGNPRTFMISGGIPEQHAMEHASNMQPGA